MVLETLIGAGIACASVRYAWWRPAISWQRPRVLMYHMISDHRRGARFNKLRVTPRCFAQQLDWLKRQRFTFIFASQLYSAAAPPERSVCLTFDDGYEDNLANADRLLAEYGAVASLYLVADRAGGWSSKKSARHADDELQAEPKLTDDQVRRMIASRRWELGGHTRSHANLAKLSDSEAREEIEASRDAFPRAFQVMPATFAYPFGIYGPQHAEMVRCAGYAGAVTTEPGVAPHPCPDPMQTPRIKVSGNETLLGFILRMRGGRRGVFK